MAATITNSGPPAEDAEPSQDDLLPSHLRSVQAKRIAHAAQVTTPADEKLRQFQLTIRFTDKQAGNSTVNLFANHKAFVSLLMETATGDVHLHPTARSEAVDYNAPATITTIDGFPQTDATHKKFFHRSIYRDDMTKTTTIKIDHCVLMKETVAEIKKTMKIFCNQNKLRIVGGDLNSVESRVLGWFPRRHPQMTNRANMEKIINENIKRHPRLQELVEKYVPKDETKMLPYLYVHKRDQSIGGDNNRVTTKMLTVSCVINRTQLMKDLLSDMPSEDLGYDFLPSGYLQLHGVAEYQKWMMSNNDYQNEVQGITVLGFFPSLFEIVIEVDTLPVTISQYFLQKSGILHLEPTVLSESDGRFIFIVTKTAFSGAKTMIQKFCSEIFPKLYGCTKFMDDYKKEHGTLPQVHETAPTGGAVSNRSNFMFEKMNKVKSSSTTSSTGSVTHRTVFDGVGEYTKNFPNLQSDNGKATPKNTDASSQGSTASSYSQVVKGRKVQSSSQSQTSDTSTIISEVKSLISAQSKQFETMMTRNAEQVKAAQDRQDKLETEARKERSEMRLQQEKATNEARERQERNEAETRARQDQMEARIEQGSARQDQLIQALLVMVTQMSTQFPMNQPNNTATASNTTNPMQLVLYAANPATPTPAANFNTPSSVMQSLVNPTVNNGVNSSTIPPPTPNDDITMSTTTQASLPNNSPTTPANSNKRSLNEITPNDNTVQPPTTPKTPLTDQELFSSIDDSELLAMEIGNVPPTSPGSTPLPHPPITEKPHEEDPPSAPMTDIEDDPASQTQEIDSPVDMNTETDSPDGPTVHQSPTKLADTTTDDMTRSPNSETAEQEGKSDAPAPTPPLESQDSIANDPQRDPTPAPSPVVRIAASITTKPKTSPSQLTTMISTLAAHATSFTVVKHRRSKKNDKVPSSTTSNPPTNSKKRQGSSLGRSGGGHDSSGRGGSGRGRGEGRGQGLYELAQTIHEEFYSDDAEDEPPEDNEADSDDSEDSDAAFFAALDRQDEDLDEEYERFYEKRQVESAKTTEDSDTNEEKANPTEIDHPDSATPKRTRSNGTTPVKTPPVDSPTTLSAGAPRKLFPSSNSEDAEMVEKPDQEASKIDDLEEIGAKENKQLPNES